MARRRVKFETEVDEQQVAVTVRYRKSRQDRDAWSEVGRVIVAWLGERFDSQTAPDGSAWLPRQIPSYARILSRANRGQRPSEEDLLEDRPALVDLGLLKEKWRIEVTPDRRGVTVRSERPYARNHQLGGEQTIPVSETARGVLNALLDDDDLEDFHPGIARILKRGEHRFELRPRKIVGVSEELLDDLADVLRARGAA